MQNLNLNLPENVCKHVYVLYCFPCGFVTLHKYLIFCNMNLFVIILLFPSSRAIFSTISYVLCIFVFVLYISVPCKNEFLCGLQIMLFSQNSETIFKGIWILDSNLHVIKSGIKAYISKLEVFCYEKEFPKNQVTLLEKYH